MLVPEARQALEWLKEVSARVEQKPGSPLSEEDMKRIEEAGIYLDGARGDCEDTLAALDELGEGEGGYSNPIRGLAFSFIDNRTPDARTVMKILDEAIRTLEDYDDQEDQGDD